ncbi:MAG: hypothetical protein PCFJNLEI_04189 [Verrucomicrobiae bacterium]|nr:hypothetical protein [Verrucomicrobiae bacterium]
MLLREVCRKGRGFYCSRVLVFAKIPRSPRHLTVVCGLEVSLVMDISPNRCVRLCVEIGLPCPLAACVMLLVCRPSNSLPEMLVGFPLLIAYAYAFGIVPSLLYAGLMEIWFGLKLDRRCGSVATVIFSGLLGAASGFSIQLVTTQATGGLPLVSVGGIVGLGVGVILRRYP